MDYSAITDDYLKLSKSDVVFFRYLDRQARHASAHPRLQASIDDRFGQYWFYHFVRFLFPPSAVSRQPSAVSRQPSAVSRQPSAAVQTPAEHVWRQTPQGFTFGLQTRTHFWSRVFLATDDPNVRSFANLVLERNVFYSDFVPQSDGNAKNAVVDQTLRSRCDALVVTDTFSFVYFANANAGLLFLLNFVRQNLRLRRTRFAYLLVGLWSLVTYPTFINYAWRPMSYCAAAASHFCLLGLRILNLFQTGYAILL